MVVITTSTVIWEVVGGQGEEEGVEADFLPPHLTEEVRFFFFTFFYKPDEVK